MIRASFAGFSTALSALQANQKRLDITGQNLANMNTVGYTRQALQVSSVNYSNPVSHYMNGSEVVVGFGVHMDKVVQIRDPYLDIQYRTQMHKSGYNDSVQDALDRLSNVFDESQINGIRSAFDDIQATLTAMQDLPNVRDPIYESELRIRMQALANKLNEASREIDQAEREELAKLDGRNVNEQGSVERINDILQQIGSLNRQIKRNQIGGQQSLELMDERNVLLDELASYIPIEVEYYKDADHDGIKNGQAADYELYDYDGKGNIIGRKEWPDDLRVKMVYETPDGKKQTLTLVEGTVGNGSDNYGSLDIGKLDANGSFAQDANGQYNPPDVNDPTNVGLIFHGTKLDWEGNTVANPDVEFKRTYDPDATDPTTANKAVISNQFPSNSGSIQGSLDMLWKDGTMDGINDVNGYEFYRNQLDTLASSFAEVINTLNYHGNGGDQKAFLLANKDTKDAQNITAANISINEEWTAGNVHVGTVANTILQKGEDYDPDANGNTSDTIKNMLEAMTATYPYDNFIQVDTAGNKTPLFDKLNLKDNSFSDFMNYTSTVLANDSFKNSNALKTNVTVLNGIQSSRDSVSGVSLDEEASNMMMYMSAYNAASRVMTTLDEALDRLINSTGTVGR